MGSHPMVSDAYGLADLVGREVNSVCFVRDYAEFHFDGPILRSFSGPVVHVGTARYEFPDAGSRDALCDLIGQVVEAADNLADRLSLRLRGGAIVDIPKASDDAGPEIAHFVPVVEGKLNVALDDDLGQPASEVIHVGGSDSSMGR